MWLRSSRFSPRTRRAGSLATSLPSTAAPSSEPPKPNRTPFREQPMTTITNCITCPRQPQRESLSYRATTLAAVITAMTFAASGAAPTTLYQHYQETFGLTPFMLTVIFGAHVLSLLGALLTVGSLSDYIGRRPAILAALSLNVVAMVMFI